MSSKIKKKNHKITLDIIQGLFSIYIVFVN